MTRSVFGGLLRKETFHILRDRRTLAVVILMPIAQVLLFGYAVQTDVDEVRLLVVDPAPDVRTLELRNRFEGSPAYRIVEIVRSTSHVDEWFERGAADQALVFEHGFGAALHQPGGAAVLAITDGASPTTAGSIEASARAMLLDYQRELLARTNPQTHATAGVRVAGHVRHRFNPTLESQFLFVPGLLAFVLTIISALMTAITLAREKETGTLEILLVSPLRPVDIILGKVLPYLALAFFNAVTTLFVGWSVFGVPVRGSLLLAGESLLFVAVCLALGVLISARMPSQRAAMIAVIVGTMLPTAILSGMIFPIESMPGWLQPITYLVPARWFINIVRGVMLKGAGLETLWSDTLVLAGMTVALLAASVRSFSARLE